MGVGKRTRRQSYQHQDWRPAGLAETGQRLEVVGACILQVAAAGGKILEETVKLACGRSYHTRPSRQRRSRMTNGRQPAAILVLSLGSRLVKATRSPRGSPRLGERRLARDERFGLNPAQSARPQGAAPVSRVREEGASGRFDQVAGSPGMVPTRPAHRRRRPQHSGKERRRVGGNSRRRSPRRAWPRAGPVAPSPLRSYAPAVKEMSAADDAPVLSRSPLRVSAERLVRFGDGLSQTRREARSTGPFMPAFRHGTTGGDLCFPIGRCEGTLGSAPFRRLAELVGFGNRGMRDCATPNPPHPSLARASLHAGSDFSRRPGVRMTAAVAPGVQALDRDCRRHPQKLDPERATR